MLMRVPNNPNVNSRRVFFLLGSSRQGAVLRVVSMASSELSTGFVRTEAPATTENLDTNEYYSD